MRQIIIYTITTKIAEIYISLTWVIATRIIDNLIILDRIS